MIASALVIARRFGFYLLIACALLLGLGWPALKNYEAGLERTLLAREQGYLDVTQRMVHRELFGLCGDLQVLADSKRVSDFLDARAAAPRQDLQDYLARLVHAYARYDQIRLIGLDGQELMRVNYRDGRTTIAPAESLSAKVDRYYVQAGLALAVGQVYVSPLDLNVEQGQVEQPLVPMLRLVTPVADGTGRKRALAVLNYRAQGLLDSFRATMAQTGLHQGMLLNAEGQWLSNHSRSNEWGWLLGHPERSFAVEHPQIWREMAAREDPHALLGEAPGEIRSAEGIYLYRTLYPLKFSASELPNLGSAERLGLSARQIKGYRWELVLFVPREAWLSASLLRQPAGWLAIAAVLLLTTITAFTLAQWRVSRQLLAQERQRNGRELEDLYDYAPCGYHSLDGNGLIVRMNATELGWLGYARDEVVGRLRYVDLAVPESRTALEQKYLGFKPGDIVQDFQVVMQRKDGSSFPVSINAAAVHNQSGELVLSRTTTMDITERRRLERALEQQARTDALTGVSNRRHFHELGERELARSCRQGNSLSLLMLDIDHFKRINDSFGHAAGDVALRTVTAVCLAQLRSTDVFARIGGEEFAALLPDTDHVAAALVAERVRQHIEQARVARPDGGSLGVTASIGLAVNDGRNADLDVLLQRADAALYRAKQQGRNRVCC